MRPVQWAARLRTSARIPSQSAHIISSARGGPGTHEVDPLDGRWQQGVCSCPLHALITAHRPTWLPSSLVNLGLPEADHHQSLTKLINREFHQLE